MPATITLQPEINQLLSAYKPVVIACTATTATGDVPALVFCDVYINTVYRRTFFSSKAGANGEYVFDIQDAIQEQLSHFMPPMDGKKIEITIDSRVEVFVKIRTSKINAAGLLEPEESEPIPGTEETQPIAGQGVQSTKFIVLNILIQNEENQDLVALLKSFRTNSWNDEALPLTRRNKTNLLTNSQSSFFPFITEKTITNIKLLARFKGESVFTEYSKGVDLSTDVNEITNAPTVNIKWLIALDNSENVNAYYWNLKWGAFNPIKIKFYAQDLDQDIVKVELFQKKDGVHSSLGTVTGSEYEISALTVGVFEYDAVVTDSMGNTGSSNTLLYTVQDSTPAPGTITLQPNETISVLGGTYKTLALNQGPLNPDGSDLITYSTNYAINLLNIFTDFYLGKGMDPAQLRIKFRTLNGYDSWSYNNTVVTNTNYTNTEVEPSQLTTFKASRAVDENGTVMIIHQFHIYHTADPTNVFTNYLQMSFD